MFIPQYFFLSTFSLLKKKSQLFCIPQKKNGKVGEASRWRVCHQQGLHRLVFMYKDYIYSIKIFNKNSEFQKKEKVSLVYSGFTFLLLSTHQPLLYLIPSTSVTVESSMCSNSFPVPPLLMH